jgi:DNA-3-methyladenine glycosylase I
MSFEENAMENKFRPQAAPIKRCNWAESADQLMQAYHDYEWGTPCHNDQHLFELLSLEIMQAGLSWQTILNKRAAFRQALANFDFYQVQAMAPKLPQLLANPKIVRNQAKLTAIINNAKIAAQINKSGQTFNNYLWQMIDYQPIVHHYQTAAEVPATDPTAIKISQTLKKAGFKFTGPVVVYSFMQAAGLVNDHQADCFLAAK